MHIGINAAYRGWRRSGRTSVTPRGCCAKTLVSPPWPCSLSRWALARTQPFSVQAYFPLYQQPLRNMAVVVKTTSEPTAMLTTMRQQVSQLDPALPIFGIQTMREIRNNNVAPERLNLGLLGGFAALALLLAIIGLYGLLAFTVTQRQREIGIRMALGAQRFDVLNLVVGQGMRLILAGVVIGLLGSFGLTRVLASVLFKVGPTDPLTFVTVTFSLCAVALLACYVPARRATKVDPMVALRYE